MPAEETRGLLVWIIRRTLGIALALFAFYLLVPSFWEIPPLRLRDVLAILTVVFLGVLLGVAFGRVWPLPPETGLPRVFRTVVLTIPALGIGMALHVTIEGAEGVRAYWVMFALAAWLGSTWLPDDGVRDTGEEAVDEDESAVSGG